MIKQLGLIYESLLNLYVKLLNERAGLPPTTTLFGTSLVTTAPLATTTLSPIVIPGLIMARPPIQTLSPIVTGLPKSSSIRPDSDLAHIKNHAVKVGIEAVSDRNIVSIIAAESGFHINVVTNAAKQFTKQVFSVLPIALNGLIIEPGQPSDCDSNFLLILDPFTRQVQPLYFLLCQLNISPFVAGCQFLWIAGSDQGTGRIILV